MFTSIRQPTRSLRLWLIAAVAALLLTSILEVGHAHGVFSEADDHCTLCQHSVALDKILNTATYLFLPLLLATYAGGGINRFIPSHNTYFTLIRAPPVQLHTR